MDSPTHNEILARIMSFKNNKAISYNTIPSLLSNCSKYAITPYLQLFLQFIVDNGIFSNKHKIARVSPIYENGQRKLTIFDQSQF